jgi:hypothetical protein
MRLTCTPMPMKCAAHIKHAGAWGVTLGWDKLFQAWDILYMMCRHASSLTKGCGIVWGGHTCMCLTCTPMPMKCAAHIKHGVAWGVT